MSLLLKVASPLCFHARFCIEQCECWVGATTPGAGADHACIGSAVLQPCTFCCCYPHCCMEVCMQQSTDHCWPLLLFHSYQRQCSAPHVAVVLCVLVRNLSHSVARLECFIRAHPIYKQEWINTQRRHLQRYQSHKSRRARNIEPEDVWAGILPRASRNGRRNATAGREQLLSIIVFPIPFCQTIPVIPPTRILHIANGCNPLSGRFPEHTYCTSDSQGSGL